MTWHYCLIMASAPPSDTALSKENMKHRKVTSYYLRSDPTAPSSNSSVLGDCFIPLSGHLMISKPWLGLRSPQEAVHGIVGLVTSSCRSVSRDFQLCNCHLINQLPSFKTLILVPYASELNLFRWVSQSGVFLASIHPQFELRNSA